MLRRLLTYFIAVPVIAVAPACVTSGDLQAITDSLAQVEAVAADANATGEDFEEAMDDMGKTIEEVAAEAKERTEEALKTATQTGGAVGLGSTILLNLYRNHTRKKVIPQAS